MRGWGAEVVQVVVVGSMKQNKIGCSEFSSLHAQHKCLPRPPLPLVQLTAVIIYRIHSTSLWQANYRQSGSIESWPLNAGGVQLSGVPHAQRAAEDRKGSLQPTGLLFQLYHTPEASGVL